ncbi:glutamate receptor 1-like [Penaeus chinensis]|uniref:glutamate receptor 1-like n=1 Tax=Penaeus chinensis TaxID=139456 RepID=UPI001FB8036F|nr:glutamate receptor 1-like [Penaeus chinensis]
MWNSYLREFTAEAWLLGCAVLVLLALTLTLVMRFSPGDDPVAVGDAIMVVVAALCQTGTTINFSAYSSRILVIALFLTCVLVYTFYTSFLISALTVNKIVLPFRTLQEMYAKQSYTFGFNGGGSLEGYFKSSTFPLYGKIWHEMVVPNPTSLQTSMDGLDQVLSRRHTFMINEVYFLSKYFHCGFYVLPGEYFRAPKTWPIQKDSPLFPVFNYQ